MKKPFMALLLGTSLALAACGGGTDTTEEEPAGTPVDAPEESTTGEGSEQSSVDVQQVIQQNCTSCHGQDLAGQGNFPALNDVGSRLSEEEIRTVIDEGQNGMPPDIIEGEEADAVAAWLAEQQ